MVYLAQYDENQIVIGLIREDGAVVPLVHKANLEELGHTIKYKTQAELDKLIDARLLSDKWDLLDVYLSDLIVTISNDRIVDVSPNSLLNIDNEINAMTDQDISMWHETWGSFEVNKVDLQEARTLRKEAKDAKIIELGIGAV